MKITLISFLVLGGATVAYSATNGTNQVESDYRALLALDDSTMAEIQRWSEAWHNEGIKEKPAASEEELQKMVRFKIDAVKSAYKKFLTDNPDHVPAMIAFGSFLCDLGEETHGIDWWLKARELDPNNAAVHNNLANHYSHSGQPKRAIEEYEAAMRLQPSEPVYHFNYANVLYLFRKDAMALKSLSEDAVMEIVLDSLKKARDLEPTNFEYAYAYAETFYRVKRPPWERALEAWEHCLQLDITPVQRDQIYTHVARIYLRLGNTAAARGYLAKVKSAQHKEVRDRLSKIADAQEADGKTVEGVETGGKNVD